MKRFIAMLLTAILLLTSVPVSSALAESVLTLPVSVRIIDEEAFYQNTSLGKVVLPEGVEEIHKKAFAGSTVTEVYLPESLNYIAVDAFDGCANVNISATRGSYAFDWAVSMGYIANPYTEKQTEDGFVYIAHDTFVIITDYQGVGGSISIPSSLEDLPVTDISWCAFQGKADITSVTIPSSVKYIGDQAFEGCSSLRELALSENLVSIGWQSFKGTAITYLTMPEGLLDIGSQAFSDCTNLEIISIPASLESLGAGAFKDCRIKSLSVATGSTRYSAVDGVLFNADGSELILYPSGKSNTTYTVPDTVTRIDKDAFESAENLTSIIIPDTVKSIESNAFAECRNLMNIELPETLESIGSSAFSGCELLNEIRIPVSVKTIGDYAFDNCPNLTIYGYADTPAEAYAEENLIPFIDINKESQLNAPKDLEAAVLTESSLKLTWDTVEGAVAYQLYKLEAGGEMELLDTVSSSGGAAASHSINGGMRLARSRSAEGIEWTASELNAGQTYEFCAASVMADESTSTSDTIQVTMPQLPTPQNVRVEEQLVADMAHYSDNARDVKVTWDAVDGATKYEVYRLITSRYGGGRFDLAELVSTVTDNTFLDERLFLNNWAYGYYIVAVQETGDRTVRSEPSEELPISDILDKPVNVQVQADGTDKAVITWDAVEYATGYRVFRTNSEGEYGNYVKFRELGVTESTSYTDLGLDIGNQIYVYKVMAVQQEGNLLRNSVYSDVGWVGDDLDKPKNLNLEKVSDTVYMLTFDAVEGAMYKLRAHVMDGYYQGTQYEEVYNYSVVGNNGGTVTVRIEPDVSNGSILNDIHVVAYKHIIEGRGFPVERYSDETVSINAEYLLPKEVCISNKKVSVSAGQAVQLMATVLPTTAQNKNVQWTSSDTSVVAVDQNGLVTGVSAGNAIITARSTMKNSIIDTAEVTVIADSEQTIEEGLYTIHSGLSDAYVLDVEDSINAIGQNVQLLTSAGTTGQIFHVDGSDDGWYTLHTVLDEKAVRVEGYGVEANVQIGVVTGSNNEKWKFYETGDGGLQIINYTGYALEVDGSTPQDGLNVFVNTITENAGQRWTLTAAELCAPGAPVDCAVSETGIVTWTEILGAESYTVNAFHTTKENVCSGVTVDDIVYAETTPVTITAVNSAGSAASSLNYTYTVGDEQPESGLYYIAPAANPAIVIGTELEGSGRVSGSAVLQYRTDGMQSRQLFKLSKSNTNVCTLFTVLDESMYYQYPDGLIDCNLGGGRSAYWRIRDAGDGMLYILNYTYGYLDTGADEASELVPGRVSDMTGSYYNPCDGSLSQKWVLIPAEFTETPVPEGVSVDTITEEGATVHWLEDLGTMSYTVTIRQGGTEIQKQENILWNSNNREANQVITGLAMGTEYTATVTAMNDNGTAESEAVRFTTKLREPNAPANLEVSDITAQGATITWGTVEGAASYNILVTAGNTTVFNETGVTSPYVCTGLTAFTEYAVMVTAVNAAGTANAGTTFKTELREIPMDGGLYTFTNADASHRKMSCYAYGLGVSTTEIANKAKFIIIGQSNGWYVIKPLFDDRRVASEAATNCSVKIPKESETTDELSLWKFYEAAEGAVYIANQKQIFLTEGYVEGAASQYPIKGIPFQGSIAQCWQIDSTSLSEPEKPTLYQTDGLIVGSKTVKCTWAPNPGVDRYTLLVHPANATGSDITIENAVSPCEVTGLNPGVSYTLTLTAINDAGSASSTFNFSTGMDEVSVKDGVWYRIGSVQEGKVLDVNGADIIVANNGGNREVFRIVEQANGWYKIYTALKEKVLKYTGSYVKTAADDGSDATLWKFYDAAQGNSGNVWIKNKSSGTDFMSVVTGAAGTSMAGQNICVGLVSNSSEASTKWKLTATNLVVPSKPDVSVSNIVYNGAKISWSSQIGTASYNVTIKQGSTIVDSKTGATSPYTSTKLSPNRTYTVTVTAVNSAGKNDSTGKTFTTPLKEVTPDVTKYYIFKAATNTSLLLDVNNGLTSNGTILDIASANQSQAQCFKLIKDADNWYQIRNVCGANENSWKNVEVKDGSTQSGAVVQIYAPSTTASKQRWKFYEAGDGAVYIRSKLSTGTVLAWNGSAAANGAAVTAVTLTEASNQKWMMVITSKAVDPKSVTIAGNPTVIRGQTTQLTATVLPENCTNKSVIWSSSNTNVASVNSSGKVTGNAVGEAIITCSTKTGPQDNTHPEAKLTVKVLAGEEDTTIKEGLYTFVSACGGKVMDVYDGLNTDKNNIHLYKSWGGNNQKFNIKPLAGGWYQFTTVLNEKVVCPNSGVKDGDNVYIRSSNGVTNGRWKFQKAGNDYYFIVNEKGYYLTVKDGKTADGTDIRVSSFTPGSNSQKWRLQPTTMSPPNWEFSDVKIDTITENSYTIRWNYGRLGVKYYSLATWYVNGNSEIKKIWDAKSPVTVTDLKPGTRYRIVLAAENGTENGWVNYEKIITTGGTPEHEFIWPTDIRTITSDWGYRIHPVYGDWRLHDGIDIGAGLGNNIVASRSGYVTIAEWYGGYGNYVQIDHGNGFVTFYGHMIETPKVKKGDYVYQGDVIGRVGSTGTSTAAHLHFGMHKDGASVNPRTYLP